MIRAVIAGIQSRHELMTALIHGELSSPSTAACKCSHELAESAPKTTPRPGRRCHPPSTHMAVAGSAVEAASIWGEC